jgi:hypothetical protein
MPRVRILCANISEHVLFHPRGWWFNGYTGYEDGTDKGCSEMTAHKIWTLGNRPKERTQHSENGKSLNSKKAFTLLHHFLLSHTLV